MNNKVSVLMANYNCAQYIKEAIDSILSQTYKEWELIIVDDCSTDNSLEIISQYSDERIRLIISEKNEGLAVSLNKAIKVATGDFLARLDPDDIALCNRFEKQLDYLQKNNDIAICGSNVIQFGEEDYITKFPEDSGELMAYLPFCSPLPHSSWMINRAKFNETWYYNDSYRSSQDYEFMYRIMKSGRKIACIQEPLVKYRIRNDSISGKQKKHRDNNTKTVQRYVLEYMGLAGTDEQIDALNFDYDVVRGNYKGLKNFMDIKRKIIKANKRKGFFSKWQLRKIMAKYSIVFTMRTLGLK